MKINFIDTHCHLDLLSHPERQILRAREKGVNMIIIPAIDPKNFETVKEIASKFNGIFYSVGIHPCRVNSTTDEDLLTLENFVKTNINDPNLVAIGEIGLDFFVKDLDLHKMKKIYCHQLNLAKKFTLPVLLHVRRSQDLALKYFKKSGVLSGIAHAFNGSEVQAQNFIQNRLLLGFGGTLTYERSLQIRRLGSKISDSSFVLETDSPDLVPAWKKANEENSPAEIPGIALCLANLRNDSVKNIAYLSLRNTLRAIPRLNKFNFS